MVKKEREREKRLMDTVQPNVPYSIGSPAWVTYLLPRYLPAKNDAITCLDAFIGEYRFIRLSTSNIAFLVFSLVYSISSAHILSYLVVHSHLLDTRLVIGSSAPC